MTDWFTIQYTMQHMVSLILDSCDVLTQTVCKNSTPHQTCFRLWKFHRALASKSWLKSPSLCADKNCVVYTHSRVLRSIPLLALFKILCEMSQVEYCCFVWYKLWLHRNLEVNNYVIQSISRLLTWWMLKLSPELQSANRSRDHSGPFQCFDQGQVHLRRHCADVVPCGPSNSLPSCPPAPYRLFSIFTMMRERLRGCQSLRGG